MTVYKEYSTEIAAGLYYQQGKSRLNPGMVVKSQYTELPRVDFNGSDIVPGIDVRVVDNHTILFMTTPPQEFTREEINDDTYFSRTEFHNNRPLGIHKWKIVYESGSD